MVEISKPKLIAYSETADWDHAIAAPSPALEPLVPAYVGHYQDLDHPVHRLQVPSTQVVLVLGFGDDLEVRSLGNKAPSRMYQSFVVGLDAMPLLSKHRGERHCIAVPLSPRSAYRLFQGASVDFAETTVSLEEIWSQDAKRLMEQLSEQSSWPQRFALVDQVLVEKFTASQRKIRPEIGWAWRQLKSRGGCVSIRQLARTIGWSDRHFATCFREHIGTTPKAAARQMRFVQAHQLLSTDNRSLCDIALACGYSDQSHFTREFQAFFGCSPDAYRKVGEPDLSGIPGDVVRR